MHIETLLPLGKVDPGLRAPDVPLNLATVFDDARLLERLGYDGLAIEECKEDPYIVGALAAQATTRLKIATAVAIAFSRSPTSTALSAWTLQRLSNGRFTLGLGTQVKAHIQRRYGMDWSPAGPWIRDYVNAVRAVWDCWQTGRKLDFVSDHYRLNLMVPLFDPGPIAHPDIPIHLAAVNPIMCRIAGECADGMRPAAQVGAAQAGRDPTRFAVAIKPLIATARTDEELEKRIRDVRARVAFYCSTPGYRSAFDYHGLGDLAQRMSVLSREQRWDEMPGMIDDEVLNLYAVVGSFKDIGQKLHDRYAGIVTHAEFSIPIAGPEDQETLAALIQGLKTGNAAP